MITKSEHDQLWDNYKKLQRLRRLDLTNKPGHYKEVDYFAIDRRATVLEFSYFTKNKYKVLY